MNQKENETLNYDIFFSRFDGLKGGRTINFIKTQCKN